MTAPTLGPSPTRSATPVGVGVAVVVLSSLTFATSGSLAKTLLTAGWSPAAVVTWRVAIAALVLLPIALWSLRGRWSDVRSDLGAVAAFGLLGVAGCQFAFFNAVESLSVGVALLLEYLGSVLVVLWMWLRHGRRPTPSTAAGVSVAIVGLLLVLDLFSGVDVSWVGVAWGLLAAIGLAAYYVTAGRTSDDSLPPLALAGLGLLLGAVALVLACLTGLLSYAATDSPVNLGGISAPWWVPVITIAVISTDIAYVTGVIGARLTGPTLATFVGLSEVVFAILIAWMVLGELPGWVQLLGGVLILVGVVGVRLGETRPTPTSPTST